MLNKKNDKSYPDVGIKLGMSCSASVHMRMIWVYGWTLAFEKRLKTIRDWSPWMENGCRRYQLGEIFEIRVNTSKFKCL